MYHFNPISKSRTHARERGVTTQRDEESCARLPDSIKLRSHSSAKVAAICPAMLAVSKVSSPAPARHPHALWIITRHPALAVCLRSYGGKARRRLRCSYCSWKLRAGTGPLLRPSFGSARAAAVLGKPSSVAARCLNGANLCRARARPACPECSPPHSPFAPAACMSQGQLEDDCSMHMRPIKCENVESQECGPPRAGPDPLH